MKFLLSALALSWLLFPSYFAFAAGDGMHGWRGVPLANPNLLEVPGIFAVRPDGTVDLPVGVTPQSAVALAFQTRPVPPALAPGCSSATYSLAFMATSGRRIALNAKTGVAEYSGFTPTVVDDAFYQALAQQLKC